MQFDPLVSYSCVTRPAYHIMENEGYMKPLEVRLGAYKVICLAVKHHGHAFSESFPACSSITSQPYPP